MPPPEPVDDDLLDGCELDFTEDPDDELTQSLRSLFPNGDPALAGEWEQLRNAGALG